MSVLKSVCPDYVHIPFLQCLFRALRSSVVGLARQWSRARRFDSHKPRLFLTQTPDYTDPNRPADPWPSKPATPIDPVICKEIVGIDRNRDRARVFTKRVSNHSATRRSGKIQLECYLYENSPKKERDSPKLAPRDDYFAGN